MVSHSMTDKYSISEAARRLGVHRATLHRWIELGHVPQPAVESIAGVRLRYWTKSEFTKVEEYKQMKYWGRGKKRSKRKKTSENKL